MSLHDDRLDRESRERVGQMAADAQDRQTEAYALRTQGTGLGVRRDREAQARTDALRIAIEVTGYTRDQKTAGFVSDETLGIYANKFANFILTGEMQ